MGCCASRDEFPDEPNQGKNNFFQSLQETPTSDQKSNSNDSKHELEPPMSVEVDITQPPMEIIQPPKEIIQPPMEIIQPPMEIIQPPMEIIQPPMKAEIIQPPMKAEIIQNNLNQDVINQIQETFKKVDRDNSGQIDKQEAIYIWKQHLTRVKIETLFNAIDEDQNGTISMDEWMNFWVLASNSGYDEYDIQDKLEDFIKETTKLRVQKQGKQYY